MPTYTFRAVVEPDDDAWYAFCPDLEDKGGATWGDTRDEALHRLNEVVHLVVADILQAGEPLPKGLDAQGHSKNPVSDESDGLEFALNKY